MYEHPFVQGLHEDNFLGINIHLGKKTVYKSYNWDKFP